MKKIIILILIFLLSISTVFAENTEDLVENSNTILSMNLSYEVQKNSHLETLELAETTQNQLDFLYSLPFTISVRTVKGLRYVIDVVPVQSAYGLFVMENTIEVTKNTLVSSLRDINLGVLNAQMSIEINEVKFNFERETYNDSELQYDLGLISYSDLLNSRYDYNEAKTRYYNSVRDLEDMQLTANNFLSLNLDSVYTVNQEEMNNILFLDSDEYIKLALLNRFELKDYDEQVKIQEAILNLYESENIIQNQMFQEEIEKAYNEIERIELEKQIMEKSIIEEIMQVLSDIEILEIQIKQLNSSINMQENSLSDLKSQSAQGYMTESTFKELEFAIIEMKNSLYSLNYMYNTNVVKLEHATQIGPAYGGGF